MRRFANLLLALAAVASAAHLHAALRPPPRRPVRDARTADPRMPEAVARLAALEAREAAPLAPDLEPLAARIDALVVARSDGTVPPPVVEPVVVPHEELYVRARARFEGAPRGASWLRVFGATVTERLDAWRPVAEHAPDAATRARAWARIAELRGIAGDYVGVYDAHRRVVETVGLRTEAGWKAAEAMAMWEWGRGDMASAVAIYRQIGRTSGVPADVALRCYVRATQLAWAAHPPDETIALHEEFIRAHQDDPDPTVIARVAQVARALQTLRKRQ